MKTHRGLSAVIGTVFMIAVVIGSLSYVTYSLDMLGNFSESLITEESRQNNKQKESFEITSVDVTGLDKLNTVIKNTGEIPLQITNLYIDEQDTNDVVRKITIDKTIAPGSSFDLLTEGIDVDIDPTKGYNLKMSTSRGTAESFFVNSASAEPLYMALHTFPSAVSTGFPSSIIFSVVNNMSNGNILYNLTPVLDVDSQTGFGTVDSSVGPFPTSYPVVKPGDVATFEYIYTVSGDEGQFIDLGISLQNGYELPGNPGYLQSLNSTVMIKDVEIAITSGSSITSFGLQTTETIEADVLFFHDQVFGIGTGWPSGTKQMSAALNFGSGSVEYTADGPIIHVTSNMTEPMVLEAGIFTAGLQYYSDPVVSTVPDPDVAFFFECKDCPNADQTTDAIGKLHEYIGGGNGFLQIGMESDNDPTWNGVDGPDNDGYYTFDNKDSWLQGMWKQKSSEGNTFNNIGDVPDADSMWVRIPPTTESYMPLLFIGETKEGSTKDGYAISIEDGGKISYSFKEDGKTPTTCITPDSGGPNGDGTYDNDNWQLITVVRTEDPLRKDCEIWVNATDTGVIPSPDGGDDTLDAKITAIGATCIEMNCGYSDELNADVAMWMHWNDAELNATHIEDLYYTNYGENGTRINMTVYIYDDVYTDPPKEIPLDLNNAILPFHDVSKNSNGDVINPFILINDDEDPLAEFMPSNSNVSGTSLFNYSLIDGDRLSVEFEIDEDEHNLPINIWIDDFNLFDNNKLNSYLETPAVTPTWPTFNTIQSGKDTTLVVFNDGPAGMWLVFSGTRFLVSSIDGLSSYGGMPVKIDAITYLTDPYLLDPTTDGPYIPDQGEVSITFTKLCNPATTDPKILGPTGNQAEWCADIPAGEYLGFVFLSGYDEEGSNFVKTIDLGNIHVEPADP